MTTQRQQEVIQWLNEHIADATLWVNQYKLWERTKATEDKIAQLEKAIEIMTEILNTLSNKN